MALAGFETIVFQSTLPVRGATGGVAAVEEGDGIFQSTLPVRGATVIITSGAAGEIISIHAPREGSDLGGGHGPVSDMDFNPRSP